MIRHLSIRPGTMKDIDFAERCYSDLLRMCLNAEKTPKIKGFYETYKACIDDPVHFPMFVAEDNGVPVGFVQLNIIQTLDYGCTSFNVTDLIVDPTIRSKGVGTFLMNYVKEYAKSRGVKSVELVTPKDGTEKAEERKKFYKKHGFHQYGPAMILEVDPDLLQSTLVE